MKWELKACINIDHIESDRWGPPLVELTGMLSARRCSKASMEKIGKKRYDSYKVKSRAVGVRKAQEAQKAKALWAMKAAKDRKEEFYDPARERTFREEIKRYWSCGKNISRIQLLRWIKH